MTLEVLVEGTGPRVVLVHGSVMDADIVWATQHPLADRWTLVRPNRRGYGNSPSVIAEDFEVDAADLAEVIEDGDHVVGHSYGALGCLLAAVKRPAAVRSLTVFEPLAFGLARGDANVEAAIELMEQLRAEHEDDLDGFLRAIAAMVGSRAPLPTPMPSRALEMAQVMFRQRRPQDARIPVEQLRDAPFPKLIVTGDGPKALSVVADVLEEQIGAERASVRGVGHSIPFAGDQLNAILERFWNTAA